MIGVSQEELAVIDTTVFQRLRGISQLALTKLVYPGTTHSRFEHCIGAMHVAGLLADKLELGSEKKRLVRLAALLHDVGHGPFSHVFEQVLEESGAPAGIHEQISAAIVRNSALVPGLTEVVRARIVELVTGAGPRSVEGDIISGPTDADKLDYLLRDSYYSGAKYGVYDLDRILDTATVIEAGNESQLGFDEDGLWAVEGLLLARHHMHRQVYGHRTRMVTDIMLSRGLGMAASEGDLDLAPPDGIGEAYLAEFLGWSEAGLSARVTDGPARDLLDRLQVRQLLKRRLTVDFDTFRDMRGPLMTALLDDEDVFTRLRISECEQAMAYEMGCQLHLIALRVDSKENPTYRPPGYDIRDKDIFFKREGKQPEELHRLSEIFSAGRPSGEKYVHLYCDEKTREAVSETEATAVLLKALDMIVEKEGQNEKN